MKMIKSMVMLFLLGIMIACNTEVKEDTVTSSETTEESINEDESTYSMSEGVDTDGVISIQDLMLVAYDDKGLGETFTVKGWFCGMLGSLGTDQKTLFLDLEQNSSIAGFEVLLDAEAEEALKDATAENEITISAKMVEYTGFGTHIKAEDCKIISID